MVKKKLETLKRIERLQKRLHELSNWKAAKLARKRDELAGAHSEMIVALGAGLLSFGGAASAATRRIRSLEVETRATSAALEAELQQALEFGLRARAVERAVKTTAAESRASAEKKSLEELIDQSLRGPVPRKA